MNALHFLRRSLVGFALLLGSALAVRAGQYVSISAPASVGAGTCYEVDAWASAGFGANIGIYLYKNGALVGSDAYYVSYYSADSGPQTVYYHAQFQDTNYWDDDEANVRILASTPTTFSVNNFTYDGTAKTVTITPNPPNATFTAGGTRTATTAGTYTATAAATEPFSGTNSNLTWTIYKATPAISWSVPSSMSYGTALPAATANIPGTFSYSANPGIIGPGTVLNAGGYVLTATFTPTDTTNYNTATTSVTVAVGQVGTTILLSNLVQNWDGNGKEVTVTTIPTGLATSVEYDDTSRGGAIYSPNCPNNVGQYEVHATSTDPNYSGTSAYQTMLILPQVSCNSQVTLTYGTALNPSQLGLSSSWNCDYSYSRTMGSILNVGNYTLVVTFSPHDAPAAAVTRTINITVNPAPLTITAGSASKTYGAANPGFSASGTGFVNGDTIAVVSGLQLNTSATAASPVGNYAIIPSGAGAANYSISYVNGALTVNQAALTITASNASKIYSAANPSFTASYNGFVNGDTSSVVSGLQLNTAATAASSVGNYAIIPSGASAANYSINYGSGTLTVTQAALKITANNASKTYGAANPGFSASYSGFVNGDTASVVSGLQISSTATTSSAAGTTYAITPSGASAANYSISYGFGTLSVIQAALTITPNAASKTYGAANPGFSASYSGFVNGDTSTVVSGLSLSTTAGTGSPVGTYAITASGATATNYSISYGSGILTVTQAPLKITPNAANKSYSAANPAFSASYSGLVNGDTSAVVSGLTLTTTATASSAVGAYPITGSGAIASNYSISYNSGTLTINKVGLTITPNNASKLYGAANPVFSAGYAGFVNGDTSAVVSGLTLSTTATAGSPVSTYPISGSGATAANYTISYGSGTLTVTRATLTITANNAAKNYGSANPSFTASYGGFVNGDTASVVSGLVFSSTATTSSAAGTTFPITPSGASAANYTIIYANGTLTVGKAPLTITPANASKIYGATNPTFTATYSGFVNGDTSSVVTGLALSTTATASSAAGTYPITGKSATAANYSVSYGSGTLTVNKATLKITANNATKVYGAALPTFTASYSGFVNGDTSAVVTGLKFTTTATATSAASTYAIVPSGAVAANYIISYVNGSLTVTQAALKITANNATKVYGSANPVFSAAYSGFVNSDTATVVSGLKFSSTATAASGVSTYPITPAGASAANYSITYVNGTLSVTPAALKITANNASRAYGAANPTFSAAYSGFVNGDTSAVVSGLNFSTTAVASSAVGAYPITGSGAAAANYTISYVSGTLTVSKAIQTITLNALTPQIYNTSQTLSTSGGLGGGTVSYAITSQSQAGAASLSGATLTLNVGVGWAEVQATKAADGNYAAATSAIVRVNAKKATQAALTLNAWTPQVYRTTQILSTSVGLNFGSVSYAIVGQSAPGVATLSTETVSERCNPDDPNDTETWQHEVTSLTANAGTGSWVDIQATNVGGLNYEAVVSPIVRVSFIDVLDPNTDSDGDGMADWYELQNGLNPHDPSDALADSNGNGVTNVDEYNLWGYSGFSELNQGGLANGLDPLENASHIDGYLNVSVLAKGTGSVTVGAQTFSFNSPGGTWYQSDSQFDVRCNFGAVRNFAVTSTGVTDFVITIKVSPKTPPVLDAIVELDGSRVDRILKSDIVGGNIAARILPGGQLPFATMDASNFAATRKITFGLGGSVSGQTAGRILFSNGALLFGEAGTAIHIIAGPALEWSHETRTHFQGRVPSGYVDVLLTRAHWTVKYYALGSYPDINDFNKFSEDTLLATYDIGLTANYLYGNLQNVTITQTAGGTSLMFEEEREGSDSTQYSGDLGGSITSTNPIEELTYRTNIERNWGWRTPGSPRRGLTEIVANTYRLVLISGTISPPQYGSITVKTSHYDGPTKAGPVASYMEQSFARGDFLLQSKVGEAHGVTGQKRYGYCEFRFEAAYFNGVSLAIPEIYTSDPLGGSTTTAFYSPPRNWYETNNLEGQPLIALGETKSFTKTFGDSSDTITTYSYGSDPVDGHAVVSSTVTKKDAVVIGGSTFSYTTGTFNGQPFVATTAKASANATTSLPTISKNYSRRIQNLDLRSKPISIQNPDGTKTSYAYQRGTLSGDTWTPDGPTAQVKGPDLLVATLNGAAGSSVVTYRGVAVDPLNMDIGRSTVTEQIINRYGLVAREANYVYQSGGTFAKLNSISYGYDALLHLTSKTDASGRLLFEAYYNGFQKKWEVDEQGITLSYTYDDYGCVETKTRSSAAYGANTIAETTTTYGYDNTSRLKTETVSAVGETGLGSSYTYDTADRIKSRTLQGNLVTSMVYDSDTQTTTTLPGGGTKIELLYRDGRTHSVTGTAVPDSTTTYAYDTTSGNFITTQTTAGQTATTEADWLGRTINATTATWGDGITPGSRTLTNTYNALGQLASQQTTSGGTKVALTHLYEYDPYGWLKREALDANANGAIDLATDLGVKQYEFKYQSDAPGDTTGLKLYRYDGVQVWPYAGTNAGTSRYASQSYAQLTGLSATTVSQLIAFDFDRNQTTSTTTVDRTNKLLTASTTTTGTNQTLLQVSLNGLPIKSVNAQGQTTLMTYDGLGRPESSSDPRIGMTSMTYFDHTTLVDTITAPDLKKTSHTYDKAGRLASQTNNNNKTAYFQYDVAGNLTHQWGDPVNPVRYEYNELGQKTKMHTYRSGTWNGATLPSGFADAGDVTTWTYQAATGLLNSKQDAVLKTTSYKYDVMNRPSQRTDARNWVTNYTYTSAGQPWVTSYTDGITPSVTCTYDRAGRVQTVADVAGTRSFAYYDSWTGDSDLRGHSARLQSETLPSYFGSHVIHYDYQYGVAGRVNGAASSLVLDGGSYYSISYGYDAVGRAKTLSYNSLTPFTYTYVDNSNLVDTVAQSTTGYKRDYDYEPASNRLSTLKNLWASVTASTVQTTLTYEPLTGLRQTEKLSGTGYMTALGRSTEVGVHQDYSYTDRAELDSSAKYLLTATGDAGSMKAGTDRDYTYDPIGNRIADIVAGVAGAYTPNALNQYLSAPGVSSFIYDENGNLTQDSTRSYAYDGENRLIKVTQGTSVWNYAYDYLNRRIRKSGTGLTETRYIYNGWNLVAETDSTGTLTRRFVWGLDVSGTLQGAGGVGGLLVIDASLSSSAQYYPIYDPSHNVIGLYNGSGGLAAAYEYDPFGRPQTVAGSYGAANSFRYSTKYTDTETGTPTNAALVYYGLRYYNPTLGRFINRDPIQEAGGINLYAFCGNDGVNHYDMLGMDAASEEKERAEAAAREARRAAEEQAEHSVIDNHGGLALASGIYDGDVQNAGQAAYNGVMDAMSSDPQSVSRDSNESAAVRGAVQGSVAAGGWDRAAKLGTLYGRLEAKNAEDRANGVPVRLDGPNSETRASTGGGSASDNPVSRLEIKSNGKVIGYVNVDAYGEYNPKGFKGIGIELTPNITDPSARNGVYRWRQYFSMFDQNGKPLTWQGAPANRVLDVDRANNNTDWYEGSGSKAFINRFVDYPKINVDFRLSGETTIVGNRFETQLVHLDNAEQASGGTIVMRIMWGDTVGRDFHSLQPITTINH